MEQYKALLVQCSSMDSGRLFTVSAGQQRSWWKCWKADGFASFLDRVIVELGIA